MSHMLQLVDLHTKFSGAHPPQGPILSFSHTFSLKCSWSMPLQKILDPPLATYNLLFTFERGTSLLTTPLIFGTLLFHTELQLLVYNSVVSSHHLFWELSLFLHHLYHVHVHSQELCKLQNLYHITFIVCYFTMHKACTIIKLKKIYVKAHQAYSSSLSYLRVFCFITHIIHDVGYL